MSRRLDILFREQSNHLLSFIRNRIDDAVEAEDLLQDLFARAAENLNTLTPIENLAGWIWAAARNRVVDYYRSRRSRRDRETELTQAVAEEDEGASFDELADFRFPGIEDSVQRGELIEALYDSLDELSPEQREVFLLQAVDGRTFAEISELTGVSINTLTARKRYALVFLRRRLADLKEILDEIEH
ncbi:sigma-70 family RNA polymerase sigma factor [Marispirochaeta sp.]|jgi:RNA polymerase sigma factor (sigma-70 family)|uniref:RNA polymerase sigma factor n=1 Tax=Marispirochaeta sp. TaxID=2038653 RepID=UPI0029C93387|nr:sigma-70 family RNA polymerase sigma factor [Marispirochaeta sp.]